MRALFLLLVAANLLFFGWRVWVGEPAQQHAAGTPVAELPETLTLVDETDRTAGPAAGAASDVAQPSSSGAVPAQTPVTATAVCMSLGPFEDLDVAGAAAGRLHDRGFDPVRRVASGRVRVGYWVFLPPQADRRDAEKLRDALKARGISDLYIIGDGDNRNAVSLGVFSQVEGAEQRAAQIGKLGYDPLVTERFRDAPVYWLDYRIPATQAAQTPSLPAAADFLDLVGEAPMPRMVAIDCQQMAGD